MENERQDAVLNIFWKLLERFGAQGVTLIVSLILARVLGPKVYGRSALVLVVTTILQVFIESGLSSALIQDNNADQVAFSTVFYFNLILCCVLYLLLFVISPNIAAFYDAPDLTAIFRVLGLLLIISGFKSIQVTFVSKNLLFKKYFLATIVGTVCAAAIGLYMAYSGCGIWSLVIQNLVNQFIDTILLWILVKWRPTRCFSGKKLISLFSYGWKLLVSTLINSVWDDIVQLIIGKKFSKTDLAFYNKGNEYPKYATSSINNAIDSVLFPLMSKNQDSVVRVREIMQRSIKTSSFLIFPMMYGFAACSTAFVKFILTDAWLPAIPYIVVFCVVYSFYPIQTANLNAMKALGRSDLFLTLEIVKKLVGLIIIVITMQFSVMWLAIGMLISCIFSIIINSWPNRKLLNYSILYQIRDFLPAFLLSIFMAAIVYAIDFIGLHPGITLAIQIPVGVVVYVGFAYIFKMESYVYCKNIAIEMLQKRRQKNADN